MLFSSAFFLPASQPNTATFPAHYQRFAYARFLGIIPDASE
ncbi:hypothetical protein [Escherichia coli]|nr:hypothetical protein [Escherichia coli]